MVKYIYIYGILDFPKYNTLYLFTGFELEPVSATISSESCGEGWEKNGEHCYFWSTEKKNWNDAEDFCQMKGGHLASVGSEATRQYLEEGANRVLADGVAPSSDGIADFWLGGHDMKQEGVWKWTDGTPWEVEFWKPGEPNNWKHPAGVENCVEHNARWNGWNDDLCTKNQVFVCSKNTNKKFLNSNATVI